MARTPSFLFEPHNGWTPDNRLAQSMGEDSFPFGYITLAETRQPIFALETILEYPPEELSAYALLLVAAPALLDALKRLIPTNINLDHPNLKDDLTVPCDVTLGELRAARDAISQATGAS